MLDLFVEYVLKTSHIQGLCTKTDSKNKLLDAGGPSFAKPDDVTLDKIFRTTIRICGYNGPHITKCCTPRWQQPPKASNQSSLELPPCRHCSIFFYSQYSIVIVLLFFFHGRCPSTQSYIFLVEITFSVTLLAVNVKGKMIIGCYTMLQYPPR